MANETSTENLENEFFTNAEELESLYLRLETSIPELQWKNPGRILEEEKVETQTEESQNTQETPAKTDFDFSDDTQPQPSQQLRTVRGPKPKKKTANFADVVKRINIA